MKIIIDYEDGHTNTIENVMDYSILAKEDLVDAVNDAFDSEEIENNYNNLTEEVQDELWSKVQKNCGYYDSIPSMEEFRGEVFESMRELGLIEKD